MPALGVRGPEGSFLERGVHFCSEPLAEHFECCLSFSPPTTLQSGLVTPIYRCEAHSTENQSDLDTVTRRVSRVVPGLSGCYGMWDAEGPPVF